MAEPVINEAIQGELDAIASDFDRKVEEKVAEIVAAKDAEIAALKVASQEEGARLVIDHLKSRLGLL